MASASPPPSPSNDRGLLVTMFSRLLDYMHTPWKAITIIVIIVMAGLGWLLWTERVHFLSYLQPKHAPALKADVDLDQPLRDLLAYTDADLAMIWSLDLSINELVPIKSRKREGGVWPEGDGHFPALTELSHLITVVKILNGEPICASTAEYPGNLLLRRLHEDGYRYFCGVPVPPAANEPTLAILYIAWHKVPSDLARNAALSIGRSISARTTR